MGKVIINQQEFSYQEIQGGKWPKQEPYFEESLTFCHQWLSGKDDFTFKTSGSTGVPKDIQVSREQMASSARATGEFFHIQPNASLLCCLNTAMVAGKMMLVRAMEWDSLLYLIPPSSNPLILFPADQVFDFSAMVPLQFETCFDHEQSRGLLHRIQNLLIGGAAPSSALRQKATHLTGNLFQTYGMTETVSHIALADLQAQGALVYETLPHVKIRTTPGLRLEVMAAMSNHQWLITNDLVEIVSQNRFIWKGRADFTINTGGIKVQPEETETFIADAMNEMFPRQRYFITGLPDPKLGQKVVLMVEGEEKGNEDAEKALNLLKNSLPAYHHPKYICFVPEFTETVSNKTDRNKTVKNWQKLKNSLGE